VAYAAHAQMEIRTLAPRHATATELVPVIRPLLTPPESVSAFRGRLVVKARTATFAELERVLSELDRPPVGLVISVRRGRNEDRGQTRLGGGSGIVYRHTRSREDLHSTQRVRVLEGRTAFIDAGTEQPTVNRIVSSDARGSVVLDSLGFERATTGFYVRVHTRGKRVDVEIAAHQRRPNTNAGFDLFHASTTVSGSLGQWLPVGGSLHRTDRGTAGVGTDTRSGVRLETRSAHRSSHAQIWLRVERAN